MQSSQFPESTPLFVCLFFPARQEIARSSLSSQEPSTIIQFTYTSNTQMYNLLKRTAAKCSHISHVYSIGRSAEGRDLLVIEFTGNPGKHELCESNFPLQSVLKLVPARSSRSIQLVRNDMIRVHLPWHLLLSTLLLLKTKALPLNLQYQVSDHLGTIKNKQCVNVAYCLSYCPW